MICDFWRIGVCIVFFGFVRMQNVCFTPNNHLGDCVPVQQCPDLSQLLAKQILYRDDLEFLRRSKCGNVAENNVCCPITETGPVTQPENTTEVPYSNLLPRPGECGEFISTDRVILGNNTRIYEHPWMALIEYTKPLGRKGFHCAGTLINHRYVLSAAHCSIGQRIRALKWKPYRVRLGEWNMATEKDCEDDDCSDDPIDVAIEEVINHEGYIYNQPSQQYDIALIRLTKSVAFTDWIKPACLPVAENLRRKNYDNHSMEVVGWGFTENGTRSSIKQKARLGGINLKVCQMVYNDNNVTLDATQLCAAGEIRGNLQADSCGGDSGGPLMDVQLKGAEPYMYIAAIVSYGPEKCGTINKPGVYIRVGPFIDWIINNIRA